MKKYMCILYVVLTDLEMLIMHVASLYIETGLP